MKKPCIYLNNHCIGDIHVCTREVVDMEYVLRMEDIGGLNFDLNIAQGIAEAILAGVGLCKRLNQ